MLLPVKSVGVVGDQRRYEWVIALRAVETIDFMTARWVPFTLINSWNRYPIELLMKSVEYLGLFMMFRAPPATIGWE